MTIGRAIIVAILGGCLCLGTCRPGLAAGGPPGSEHPFRPESTGAATIHTNTPALYYDVESSNSYCDGRGSYCHVGAPQYVTSGYHYGEVDVYGANPNQSFGVPANVYVDCDRAFEQDGTLYYQFAYALAYDDGPGNSSGTLLGFAGVLSSDASEENTAARSIAVVGATGPTSMNYDSNPPNGYDSGTAFGVQITDNSQDLPASGGLRITVTGTIYNQHYDTTSQEWITDSPTTGTLSCFTGGQDANAVGDAYAEGEMETSSSNP